MVQVDQLHLQVRNYSIYQTVNKLLKVFYSNLLAQVLTGSN